MSSERRKTTVVRVGSYGVPVPAVADQPIEREQLFEFSALVGLSGFSVTGDLSRFPKVLEVADRAAELYAERWLEGDIALWGSDTDQSKHDEW